MPPMMPVPVQQHDQMCNTNYEHGAQIDASFSAHTENVFVLCFILFHLVCNTHLWVCFLRFPPCAPYISWVYKKPGYHYKMPD